MDQKSRLIRVETGLPVEPRRSDSLMVDPSTIAVPRRPRKRIVIDDNEDITTQTDANTNADDVPIRKKRKVIVIEDEDDEPFTEPTATVTTAVDIEDGEGEDDDENVDDKEFDPDYDDNGDEDDQNDDNEEEDVVSEDVDNYEEKDEKSRPKKTETDEERKSRLAESKSKREGRSAADVEFWNWYNTSISRIQLPPKKFFPDIHLPKVSRWHGWPNQQRLLLDYYLSTPSTSSTSSSVPPPSSSSSAAAASSSSSAVSDSIPRIVIDLLDDDKKTSIELHQAMMEESTKGKKDRYLMSVSVHLHNRNRHANVIGWTTDTANKITSVYVFEPHGNQESNTHRLYQIFLLHSSLFGSTIGYNAYPGPQSKEGRSSHHTDLTRMGKHGKCALWCMVFVQLALLNPSLSLEQINALAFESMTPNVCSNFIQRYATFVADNFNFPPRPRHNPTDIDDYDSDDSNDDDDEKTLGTGIVFVWYDLSLPKDKRDIYGNCGPNTTVMEALLSVGVSEEQLNKDMWIALNKGGFPLFKRDAWNFLQEPMSKFRIHSYEFTSFDPQRTRIFVNLQNRLWQLPESFFYTRQWNMPLVADDETVNDAEQKNGLPLANFPDRFTTRSTVGELFEYQMSVDPEMFFRNKAFWVKQRDLLEFRPLVPYVFGDIDRDLDGLNSELFAVLPEYLQTEINKIVALTSSNIQMDKIYSFNWRQANNSKSAATTNSPIQDLAYRYLAILYLNTYPLTKFTKNRQQKTLYWSDHDDGLWYPALTQNIVKYILLRPLMQRPWITDIPKVNVALLPGLPRVTAAAIQLFPRLGDLTRSSSGSYFTWWAILHHNRLYEPEFKGKAGGTPAPGVGIVLESSGVKIKPSKAVSRVRRSPLLVISI